MGGRLAGAFSRSTWEAALASILMSMAEDLSSCLGNEFSGLDVKVAWLANECGGEIFGDPMFDDGADLVMFFAGGGIILA